MEIQVGEYVRTRNGIIAKLEYINELSDYFFDRTIYRKYSDTIEFLQEYELEKYIVKHSENLIDLIEVGDVIQLKGEERLKYEILKISWSDTKGKHIHIINPFRTEGGKDIFIEDIEGIVTKEQFESIKYEV